MLSHSNLLLLEGSGEEIIFSKIYFTPAALLVDFLVENLFLSPTLNYVLLSILELLT